MKDPLEEMLNTYFTAGVVFCFGAAIIILIWGIAMYRLISTWPVK